MGRANPTRPAVPRGTGQMGQVLSTPPARTARPASRHRLVEGLSTTRSLLAVRSRPFERDGYDDDHGEAPVVAGCGVDIAAVRVGDGRHD